MLNGITSMSCTIFNLRLNKRNRRINKNSTRLEVSLDIVRIEPLPFEALNLNTNLSCRPRLDHIFKKIKHLRPNNTEVEFSSVSQRIAAATLTLAIRVVGSGAANVQFRGVPEV